MLFQAVERSVVCIISEAFFLREIIFLRQTVDRAENNLYILLVFTPDDATFQALIAAVI